MSDETRGHMQSDVVQERQSSRPVLSTANADSTETYIIEAVALRQASLHVQKKVTRLLTTGGVEVTCSSDGLKLLCAATQRAGGCSGNPVAGDARVRAGGRAVTCWQCSWWRSRERAPDCLLSRDGR